MISSTALVIFMSALVARTARLEELLSLAESLEGVVGAGVGWARSESTEALRFSDWFRARLSPKWSSGTRGSLVFSVDIFFAFFFFVDCVVSNLINKINIK